MPSLAGPGGPGDRDLEKRRPFSSNLDAETQNAETVRDPEMETVTLTISDRPDAVKPRKTQRQMEGRVVPCGVASPVGEAKKRKQLQSRLAKAEPGEPSEQGAGLAST